MKLLTFLLRPQPTGTSAVLRQMGRRVLVLGCIFLSFTAAMAIAHFLFDVPLDGLSEVPERNRAIDPLLLFGGAGMFAATFGWLILSWLGPAPPPDTHAQVGKGSGFFHYANVFMRIWRILIVTAMVLVALVAILPQVF